MRTPAFDSPTRNAVDAALVIAAVTMGTPVLDSATREH